jgi:1,2-dihydroxy-3-keto-5-methylthiopentene dioxygenase
MTTLRVFNDLTPETPELETTDATAIAATLATEGIKFERWHLEKNLSDNASSDEILSAYQIEIDKLMKETGYQSFDVITMEASHPQKNVLRAKFFAEHTHSEDEIRFFVRGRGLFTMHVKEKVFELTCEKDDLINVPAGIPHWFDMGDTPNFTCIRLFDSPDGWIATYTGSTIANGFSKLQS